MVTLLTMTSAAEAPQAVTLTTHTPLHVVFVREGQTHCPVNALQVVPPVHCDPQSGDGPWSPASIVHNKQAHTYTHRNAVRETHMHTVCGTDHGILHCRFEVLSGQPLLLALSSPQVMYTQPIAKKCYMLSSVQYCIQNIQNCAVQAMSRSYVVHMDGV